MIFGAHDVEALARRGDTEGLLAALRHEEVVQLANGYIEDLGIPIRVSAALALAGADDARVADALLDSIERDDPEVQQAAVSSLPRVTYPRTVKVLGGAALSWDSEQLRGARERAVEHLEALARQAPDLVAEHFADAFLGSAGSSSAAEEEQVVVRVARALSSDGRQRLVATAVAGLAGDLIRANRARRLLAFLPEASLGPLVDALQRTEHQAAVARTLGDLRDSRATPWLVELLVSERLDVRAAAADALGEIRDTRTVGELLRLLEDPEPAVRDAAQHAIDRMGTAGSILVLGTAARAGMAGLLGSEDLRLLDATRGAAPADKGAPLDLSQPEPRAQLPRIVPVPPAATRSPRRPRPGIGLPEGARRPAVLATVLLLAGGVTLAVLLGQGSDGDRQLARVSPPATASPPPTQTPVATQDRAVAEVRRAARETARRERARQLSIGAARRRRARERAAAARRAAARRQSAPAAPAPVLVRTPASGPVASSKPVSRQDIKSFGVGYDDGWYDDGGNGGDRRPPGG